VSEEDALEYLKGTYGATITTVDDLAASPAGVSA
jgi:hypothetical protein